MVFSTFFLCLVLLAFSCSRGFNLSPIESVVLRPRLDHIAKAVKKEFSSIVSDKNVNTFIFPGAGGVDELVIELQAKTPRSKIVDWKRHRGSILTAAYDGEAVGTAISDLLLDCSQKSLHFIGISVGSFCANAAATSIFKRETDLPVRLTLLDPFCGRGVFAPNYGEENFGKYATTAIQILNTDDPVPTTNNPLPNCVCFDVTNDPRRANFVPPPGDSMHSWPVAYFARHFVEPTPLQPRGTVLRS